MKKILFFSVLATILTLGSFLPLATAHPLIAVIHDGIHFSESVCPYDGGLFISNFGSDEMSPRIGENKGYILYRKDGNNKTIVPANGSLHKPTGMAVKDGFLFVCDETRLLVYNLKNLSDKPQTVHFPKEDKVLNALALDGNRLYISVTDTGHIYTLDISNPNNMASVKPEKWLDISGPNGMAIGNGVLYIATISTDYSTVQPNNVIYCVRDLNTPTAEKFLDTPGLYDGAALSDDGTTLYLSDWKTASVTAVDVVTKKVRIIYAEEGTGPADIAQADGVLYIPDLPNHRIIEIDVKK